MGQALFRFSGIDSEAADDRPVILGTDLHILMGEVDRDNGRSMGSGAVDSLRRGDPPARGDREHIRPTPCGPSRRGAIGKVDCQGRERFEPDRWPSTSLRIDTRRVVNLLCPGVARQDA